MTHALVHQGSIASKRALAYAARAHEQFKTKTCPRGEGHAKGLGGLPVAADFCDACIRDAFALAYDDGASDGQHEG